ncbi:hypothetical protein MRX96_008365 [Rhipicephalus microplus]
MHSNLAKKVTPICLPMTRVPLVNKNAIVSGWGSLYYGGQGVDFLRQTTVSIYPSIICSLLYSRFDYSDVYQCCANRVGKGACKGDSGGPLMLRTGTGTLPASWHCLVRRWHLRWNLQSAGVH